MIRPVLMGAWGHGFPYGIFSHLDWVSNVGYQYLHFHYNPAHMLAVTLLLHHDCSRWRCTASLVLSATNPPKGEPVKTAGAREHLLPRHRSATRSARSASIASACSSRCRPASGARSASSSAARSGPAAGRSGGAGGSTCRSGASAKGRRSHGRISEHLHPGSGPRPRLCRACRCRRGSWTRAGHAGLRPTWLGKIGDAQIGPIYLGCDSASPR